MADIVVRDQGSEIDQRADIERSRQGDEVGADQPAVERFKAIRATISSSPNATSTIQMKAAMRHQVSSRSGHRGPGAGSMRRPAIVLRDPEIDQRPDDG